MNIEVKNSEKPVDYLESMKILEKRVNDVFLGKNRELLFTFPFEEIKSIKMTDFKRKIR